MVMQRGVSLTDLEQGARTSGFDTAGKGFAKKSNQVNRWFLIGGILVGIVIVLILGYAIFSAGRGGPGARDVGRPPVGQTKEALVGRWSFAADAPVVRRTSDPSATANALRQ
jgi:hypothetical protein